MHDVLRARVLRKIESLPEAQMYQVLDYIEFLEGKYAKELAQEASGLQKLAEGLEDKLRKRAVNPANLREAFQLIAAADRALSGVTKAGKQLLGELNGVLEEPKDGDDRIGESDARDRVGPDELPTGGGSEGPPDA
jgi:hypothetical protein